MLIRSAELGDSLDVLSWRNDEGTRAMSFDSDLVSEAEHNVWYAQSLVSSARNLYIGELQGKKIGVSRFDLAQSSLWAEVSINLNPDARGKGLAPIFLAGSIERYLKLNEVDLIAKVKTMNARSLGLFESVGFFKKEVCGEQVTFVNPKRKLTFESVEPRHAIELYDLLRSREHFISHRELPSFSKHESFVKSHPYLHWYLVSDEHPIGAFYIQSDNSIGLNLLSVRPEWVSEVMRFIGQNFSPRDAIPSKVPPYFYFNSAVSNKKMVGVLENLGLVPFQISHKIQ